MKGRPSRAAARRSRLRVETGGGLDVAKFSLRRYEDQATASVVLAIAGLILAIPLAYLVFRNFNTEFGWIWYNPKSPRKLLVLLFAAVTGGTALLGFGFGLNSLGQRRNTNQSRSWLGFILGGVGMLAAFLLLASFWLMSKPAAVSG
jgi:hypothetical protein